MKLSDTSIRRPVLASMLSAALVLFGVISYTRLSVREFPDVDPPVISVTTVLPGANPQVMESAVTDPLEDELSTVPGLRTLTSASAEQVSTITLEFNLDRAVEEAAQDVRDRVSRVRGFLPEDIEEPVVEKQEADAFPFFWLALSGQNYSLLQLSDIGDRMVKNRLQSLKGVGQARIFGERRFSMRVWLSTAELAARGLTVQDVESAIRSRNVEIPAGRIESRRREFTVRSLGELKTPEEFAELTVANQAGNLTKLKDLARVELGPEDERSALRYKGTPAVAVGIIRQSKANLIEVADAIYAELPAIQKTLPPGVQLDVAFDQSVFVRSSIRDAQDTLVIAGVLVIIIIFVFLRNLRATIIPGLAIPTSIVATFAVMYFLGFSVNNLTLLALTLAIGIVVDDAIIVLENAYRHQEELRESPEEAAKRGTGEIAFAVIATTITLVAVFTPLAFLRGSTGRLFNEFGIAVAGSVVISGFVALTLTPMLCAKILKVQPRHGPVYMALERGFQTLATKYGDTLRWALARRWWVVGGAVATTLFAGVLFRSLQREFVAPEDRGWFLTFVLAPEGASLEYTDGYQRQVEEILGRTKDIDGYFSGIGMFGGVSQGFIFTRLTDWSERNRTVQDVINEVQPQFFGVTGVLAFANNPPAFGGFTTPVQYVVQHPDFGLLVRTMDTLERRAQQIAGLVNVQMDLKVNKPELTVSFDRDRAEDLGVPVRDVAATLQTMLGGRRVSTFTRNNKLYDVIVRLEPEERATPSDVSGLYVRGKDGGLVQLSGMAHVSEGVGPQQLIHFNRVRSFTLSANLQSGFTLGQALDSLDRVAAEVLPEGSTTALAGESRELQESGGALYFAFGLALLVVFMVLASQFESLVHPFTVLLAVPLAVTGALLALVLAKST
ncbi:MAG: efflux RND transporter permease subunit, partial [Gemmatimonadales bacterium]